MIGDDKLFVSVEQVKEIMVEGYPRVALSPFISCNGCMEKVRNRAYINECYKKIEEADIIRKIDADIGRKITELFNDE